MKIIFALTLNISVLFAGNTTALFQRGSLTTGPFPSDVLTIPNANENTGRQIDLPATACGPAFTGSVCGSTTLLNNLDGFSINPRTMVCFSAAIDTGTLKNGIGYLAQDSFTGPVAINQIFYDPASNCAFAKPDQVLRQQTRYLLVVTNAVHDIDGQSIGESTAFRSCLQNWSDSYCAGLSGAVNNAGNRFGGSIVSASLFTTMSATSWLEKARRFVDENEPPVVLPAGPVSMFSLENLTNINWLPQDDSGLPTPTMVNIPLSALQNVASVIFGLFLSPNFLEVSGASAGSIPDTPTNSPISPVPVPGLPPTVPAGYVPVSFHVFLPAASKLPANGNGFPVVIYGHGLSDSQFGAPTYIASTLASQGFATLAIEITGNGYGPGGAVALTGKDNQVYTVSTPGRGIELAPGQPIGPTDGCVLPGALAVRDCGRQTAVDLFAIVSVLRQTRGLGYLDPNRIYYVGQSFGTTYGTIFHAVEPAVSAAVLNSGGGTSVDVARLSFSGRPLGIEYLASLNPLLLNVPPAPQEAYFHDLFNDNYPFRDQRPLINTVPEAPALQAAFEAADWLGMNGDPLAYGPHLNLSPLAGVPPKNTLFTFGLGDLEVPNPAESGLVLAAGGLATTWYFRFDIASALQPALLTVGAPGFPLLPHRILSNPTIFSLEAEQSIALAAQRQVASFFRGSPNPDPNQYLTAPFSPWTPLFQLSPPLPEMLNFLQFSK